ncbi:Peroxisomal membrane protein PMP34 [Halotydeus destructor]|nr:Peroxisomal membrane protein PMP34 [Halotydeus destructor]
MASSVWDKLFTYETLTHACAGSVGSMTAMAVFYPLDTVRSRLQVEDGRKSKDTMKTLQELVQEEGPESLYRGLQPVLVSLCASGFVYFYTFHGLRAVFTSRAGHEHSAARDLVLGAIAGAINVLLTTPVWVVNSRLKMQGAKLKQGDESIRKYPKYKGILDGLIRITEQEGLPTLWAGTMASLLLVSNPSIQFMIYESLKRRVMQVLKTESLGAGSVFAIGALSKSISTILTYPLQLIQSKSRYGSSDVKNKRIMDIMRMIVEKNGPTGLYKGLEAKLLQTVLTTALMFMCYEKITQFVFAIMSARHRKVS